jgi:hypothetical protein
VERKGEKNKYPRLFARAEVPISSFGKGIEKGEDFLSLRGAKLGIGVRCVHCVWARGGRRPVFSAASKMSDSDGPEFDDGLSPDLGGSVSQAADGELDPDHPLLQRAQTALKKQLLNTRKEIEDKIRARREHLEVRVGFEYAGRAVGRRITGSTGIDRTRWGAFCFPE